MGLSRGEGEGLSGEGLTPASYSGLLKSDSTVMGL